jgi:hypothetical protein
MLACFAFGVIKKKRASHLPAVAFWSEHVLSKQAAAKHWMRWEGLSRLSSTSNAAFKDSPLLSSVRNAAALTKLVTWIRRYTSTYNMHRLTQGNDHQKFPTSRIIHGGIAAGNGVQCLRHDGW